MKMSPRRVKLPTCVVEFGIAVIDGDVSIERFNELNFCPGEAEAMRLGRNLEVAAVPLDNVVVADAALMEEAADTVQVFGSGTPGFFGFRAAHEQSGGCSRTGSGGGSGWRRQD